jgi:hypothetical protein
MCDVWRLIELTATFARVKKTTKFNDLKNAIAVK